MNEDLQELKKAFDKLVDSILEVMNDSAEVVLWALYCSDFFFSIFFDRCKMFTKENLPWLLVFAAAAAGAFLFGRSASIPQQPTNPAVCPDCVPSPYSPYSPTPNPCPHCKMLALEVGNDIRSLSLLLQQTQGSVNDLRRRMNLAPMIQPRIYPGFGDTGGMSQIGGASPAVLEAATKDDPKSSAPAPAGK